MLTLGAKCRMSDCYRYAIYDSNSITFAAAEDKLGRAEFLGVITSTDDYITSRVLLTTGYSLKKALQILSPDPPYIHYSTFKDDPWMETGILINRKFRHSKISLGGRYKYIVLRSSPPGSKTYLSVLFIKRMSDGNYVAGAYTTFAKGLLEQKMGLLKRKADMVHVPQKLLQMRDRGSAVANELFNKAALMTYVLMAAYPWYGTTLTYDAKVRYFTKYVRYAADKRVWNTVESGTKALANALSRSIQDDFCENMCAIGNNVLTL